MAAVLNINDLFITGDDFDAIMEILEQDEEIESQFTEAVNDVSMISVVLLACFDYFVVYIKL